MKKRGKGKGKKAKKRLKEVKSKQKIKPKKEVREEVNVDAGYIKGIKLKKEIIKHKEKVKKFKRLEKIKTYLPGFDDLMEKGIPQSSTVLVEGGPGSGKTIFCLQLINNMCKKGKKCLYMSFEEPESRLREHMKDFGWNPEELERKGLLRLQRFNALDIARSVEALLSEAKKELLIGIEPVLFPHDFKADFVMIDSLTAISSAFSGEESRFRVYIEQLFRYLEQSKITTFLIRETSHPTHIGPGFVEKAEAVSFLSDGIIIVYNVIYRGGRRGSAIELLKMRGEGFKRKIVEMDIKSGKGIIVYPNKELKGDYSLT